MRFIVLAALIGTLLAACRAGQAEPSPSPPTSAEQCVDPSSSPSSLGSETPEPSLASSSSNAGIEISGVFSSDSIEGGCAFLEAADGTRYEVLWPDGWTLLRNPFRLQDPNGEVVASGGETVTVRGQEANDMGSICMVGPIFRASEVVTIDR